MSSVSGVGGRPAVGRAIRKELIGVWAAPARNDPGDDIVRIVTGMALMIEGKLLDSLVSRSEFVEFVPEVPLVITARTRYNRWILRSLWGVVGGHGCFLACEHLEASAAWWDRPSWLS